MLDCSSRYSLDSVSEDEFCLWASNSLAQDGLGFPILVSAPPVLA